MSAFYDAGVPRNQAGFSTDIRENLQRRIPAQNQVVVQEVVDFIRESLPLLLQQKLSLPKDINDLVTQIGNLKPEEVAHDPQRIKLLKQQLTNAVTEITRWTQTELAKVMEEINAEVDSEKMDDFLSFARNILASSFGFPEYYWSSGKPDSFDYYDLLGKFDFDKDMTVWLLKELIPAVAQKKNRLRADQKISISPDVLADNLITAIDAYLKTR